MEVGDIGLSLDDVLEALADELGDVSQTIRTGQIVERRSRLDLTRKSRECTGV